MFVLDFNIVHMSGLQQNSVSLIKLKEFSENILANCALSQKLTIKLLVTMLAVIFLNCRLFQAVDKYVTCSTFTKSWITKLIALTLLVKYAFVLQNEGRGTKIKNLCLLLTQNCVCGKIRIFLVLQQLLIFTKKSMFFISPLFNHLNTVLGLSSFRPTSINLCSFLIFITFNYHIKLFIIFIVYTVHVIGFWWQVNK